MADDTPDTPLDDSSKDVAPASDQSGHAAPADNEDQSSGETVDDAAAAALAAALTAVNDLREESASESSATDGNNAISDTTNPMEGLLNDDGMISDDGVEDVADGTPLDLPVFTTSTEPEDIAGIDLLSQVTLNVRIELGRTRMLVEDVLRLNEGAVVELDKLAGDPVEIFVNDRRVARGEVLVLNDQFCVRISEIVSTEGSKADAG